MDAIEKRARELLAAHLVETKVVWGPPLLDQMFDLDLMPPTMQACVRAIIAALTPPEGYVLVPVEPTEAQLDRSTWEEVGGHCSSCTAWPASHSDARRVWAAMLAARPEVP